MNFQKDYNGMNNFKKKIKNIKNLFHRLTNKEIKKNNHNFIRNSLRKSPRNKIFIIAQSNFVKYKLKNSSSSLFQNNDADLVHSLNFDNIDQINDDTI